MVQGTEFERYICVFRYELFQVIPSKRDEGWLRIKSGFCLGIVISRVLLIIGIMICSRRVNRSWEAEQRQYAKQHRMIQRMIKRAWRTKK
jgi:hypothetical protein